MKYPHAERRTSFAQGTRVLCLHTITKPERVSRRTGEKKPAKTETHILSGTVVWDNGDTIDVKVFTGAARRYPRVLAFFPHELTLDDDTILKTFRNPLGG